MNFEKRTLVGFDQRALCQIFGNLYLSIVSDCVKSNCLLIRNRFEIAIV